MDAIRDLFNNLLGLDGFGNVAAPPDSVPLAILGLDEIPGNRHDLESAFRARAKQTHPDLADGDMIGWALAGRDYRVQEVKWARDVLLRRVPEPVTVGECTDVATLPIRHESAATVRRWCGGAPPESDQTYKLATEIVAELRARPADRWSRLFSRPVTEDQWLDEERNHIRWRARRTAELCGNCGRDLDPTETSVRESSRVTCQECQGGFGSAVEPVGCDGCGRPTKDFRRRPYIWDDELRHSRKRSFCGERCQSAFYRGRRRQAEVERRSEEGPRLCEECREVVDADRSDARYCSSACRQRAYRARKGRP